MTASFLEREATVEDLVSYEGRAELVDGQLVPMSGSGHAPVKASMRIGNSLDAWEVAHGGGHGYGDGGCFLIHTPRQQVLCPDARRGGSARRIRTRR